MQFEVSDVRQIQLTTLDILLEIDRVCKLHQIEYMLTCGTALGAVRHKGFIPWDDDLDISMTRKEYERFIKALDESLGEDYYYHCFEKDSRYNVLIPAMKIRKKGTYIKEVNKYLENHCDGDGIFVDVFIFDHFSKNKVLNFFVRTWMFILGCLMMFADNFLHINPIKLKKVFLATDRWYAKHNEGSKTWGLSMTWIFNKPNRQQIYKEEDLFPVSYGEFEGYTFPMPHNPDALLRVEIGDDYMTLPPVEKRISKHTVEFNIHGDGPKEKSK